MPNGLVATAPAAAPTPSPFFQDIIVRWGAHGIRPHGDGEMITLTHPIVETVDGPDVDLDQLVRLLVLGVHVYWETPAGIGQFRTSHLSAGDVLRFWTISGGELQFSLPSGAYWRRLDAWPLDCVGIPQHAEQRRTIIVMTLQGGVRVRHIFNGPE